jgi:hypothetical protein
MMAVGRPKNNQLCARTMHQQRGARVEDLPTLLEWRCREPRGYNSAADIRAVHQHAMAAGSGRAHNRSTYHRAARVPSRNASNAHRRQRPSDPGLRGFNGDRKTRAW